MTKMNLSNEDRMTVRGCKTPTMDCTNGAIDVNDEQCTACDSGKCNGNVYPEYRLHCLHCAGENCVLPSNSITVRYPCANYVENDSCYNIFSSGKRKKKTLNLINQSKF